VVTTGAGASVVVGVSVVVGLVVEVVVEVVDVEVEGARVVEVMTACQ
jgi:hypothetical protein